MSASTMFERMHPISKFVRTGVRISVTLLAWWFFTPGTVQAEVEVGKWMRFETVLENPSWESNPFDVELKGVFRSPGGRTLEQWGFYAGDNRWKIFFMPDETGIWTFRTRSGDSDLEGRTGSFTCVPSELAGPLHGEGPHWVLAEKGGTFPVLWNPPVSDGAHWGFRGRAHLDPMVGEALEFAAGTVGARVLGFDALLVVPTGWAREWPQSAVPYVVGAEGESFHFPFWDELNAKLDAARDLGMGHYIMLYSDDELQPDLFGVTPMSDRELRFFRYVTARLACYPIVLWDSGIDIGEYRSGSWIDWYVEWFKANDPWPHPVGSRTGGGSGGKIPEGATYFSTGGATLPDRDALIDTYWLTANQLNIPVAHTDHWRPYISRGGWDHEKIRIAHWRCALSGGQALYPDYNQGRLIWTEVTNTGGPWIGFATKFFETRLRGDLRELLPDHRLLTGGDEAMVAAIPGKEYVVYLENGGAVELSLPAGVTALEGRWYNPRDGEYSGPALRLDRPGVSAFAAPTQEARADWVLHLQAPGGGDTTDTRARPGGMQADSPVRFPERGALPARYPPNLEVERFDPGEPDYYLFGSPERSLAQVTQIQAAMPDGRFTPPSNDWNYLPRTHRVLAEGGRLQIMAIGDSIVNDTMRSGWVELLRAAYPKAEISATVYVRGGGGAQHFSEGDRLDRHVFPRRPDLVILGGISQRSIEDLAALIEMIRAGLPEVEILLGTGAFGTADPRDAAALARAPYSGTGEYGRRLRRLADEHRCAFLDFTAPWAEYLNSSGLHPHRFYRDAVHANEYGEQVLAKILLSYWQPERLSSVPLVESLEWFAENRSDPRPLRIHGLRLDLRLACHELDVALGPDPDDAGPAEAELTAPARLLEGPDIVAAINANAFEHLAPVPEGRWGTWRSGDPVEIRGWAMHPAREASRPVDSQTTWSFWVTVDGRARVSPLEPQAGARLAVGGFSPLVVAGRVAAETGGPLHPRTAIGVDALGQRVVMVVVDGRQPGYSEGMSLVELAELMQSLGCHDALNLDGGGSSILFRRLEDGSLAVVNRPASLPARPIPVMLVVRNTDPGRTARRSKVVP